MRICIHTDQDRGLGSLPYAHFGSAPLFILHDTETGETRIINNNDQHHSHGACHPLRGLGGQAVDAVSVGGIGGRAIDRLNEMGIRVYRSYVGNAKENLEHLKSNVLMELTPSDACGHYGHGCGN